MLNEEIMIIIGKNKEHIRYVLRLFEKIAPVNVIDLNDVPEDVEKKLNENSNIYIMYKDDESEFQKRWSEIYINKKPICMNVTESMTEYYAHKTIRKSFNPFFKVKAEELMDELKIPKVNDVSEIFKPIPYEYKCRTCGKITQKVFGPRFGPATCEECYLKKQKKI